MTAQSVAIGPITSSPGRGGMFLGFLGCLGDERNEGHEHGAHDGHAGDDQGLGTTEPLRELLAEHRPEP